MSDDEYLAAAIRVALKKGIICQSMEVDKKKSLREGKFTSGDICLFNKKGNELGKLIKNQLINFQKKRNSNKIGLTKKKKIGLLKIKKRNKEEPMRKSRN